MMTEVSTAFMHVFQNKSLASEKHLELRFFVDVVSLAVNNPWPSQNGLATHFWAAYPAL